MADEIEELDDLEEETEELEDREETNASEEQQEEQPSIEALASEIGWSPKDQWRGDPEDWKPASEFLKGTVTANAKLRETVKRQDRRLDEVAETTKRMAAAAEKANERAYAQALKDLKAQQREAVAEGDEETFERAERAIEELEKDRTTTTTGDQIKDPNYQPFLDDNPWYGGDSLLDVKKTAFAQQIASTVGAKYEGAAFYKKLAELVDEEFMEKPKSNRTGTNRVESNNGQMRRGSNGKKGYSDLPPEAKAACDDFVSQGIFQNRDEYVAEYFEQE